MGHVAPKHNQPTRLIEVQVASDKSLRDQVEQVLGSLPVDDTHYIAVIYITQWRPIMDRLRDVDEFPHNQVFFHEELLVFPLNSIMVPLHELCTPEEVEEVLEKYSIRKEQLPGIPSWDPIFRWKGWVKKDVIRITRSSGEVYFRLVF